MHVRGPLLVGFAALAAGCLLLKDLSDLEGAETADATAPTRDSAAPPDGDARPPPSDAPTTTEDAGTDAAAADADAAPLPDVVVPPVFQCSAYDAALCDDYERSDGLIGQWTQFLKEPGTTLEIRSFDAGRALFIGYPGGDAAPPAPLPAAYFRFATPTSDSLSWEADVTFDVYPPQVRRIVDLVLDTAGSPRVALLVRDESQGGSVVIVQHPGPDGDLYDEKPMTQKLVPGRTQRVRLAILPGDGGPLRSTLSIDGTTVVDTALPAAFARATGSVFQGSLYQIAQPAWSVHYDDTLIHVDP